MSSGCTWAPHLSLSWFYRVCELDWNSSVGSDDFVLYDSARDTMHGYPAEKNAPVKRQKVGDGHVVLESTPALEANWLASMALKKISILTRNYRRYSGANNVDDGEQAEVLVVVADKLDEIFVYEPF